MRRTKYYALVQCRQYFLYILLYSKSMIKRFIVIIEKNIQIGNRLYAFALHYNTSVFISYSE